MREIFEFLAQKEADLKAAHEKEAGLLTSIPGMLWRNKGKILGGTLSAMTLAGDAAKTQNITTNIAKGVAAAPRNVSPIM